MKSEIKLLKDQTLIGMQHKNNPNTNNHMATNKTVTTNKKMTLTLIHVLIEVVVNSFVLF